MLELNWAPNEQLFFLLQPARQALIASLKLSLCNILNTLKSYSVFLLILHTKSRKDVKEDIFSDIKEKGRVT